MSARSRGPHGRRRRPPRDRRPSPRPAPTGRPGRSPSGHGARPRARRRAPGCARRPSHGVIGRLAGGLSAASRGRSHGVMKVVLLCGGLGTRMREETEYRPKPMVEVGGRPLLWHIMKLYAAHGLTDFVCCLGYRGSMIKQYFLDYHALRSDVTVSLADGSVDYSTRAAEDWQVTLVDTAED